VTILSSVLTVGALANVEFIHATREAIHDVDCKARKEGRKEESKAGGDEGRKETRKG